MKFFFVKDKVDEGEVKIEHLPDGQMWIDMLTKPSQGIRFESDRSQLQNFPVHWPDKSLQAAMAPAYAASLAPQECVENKAKLREQLEKHRVTWSKIVNTRVYHKLQWTRKIVCMRVYHEP